MYVSHSAILDALAAKGATEVVHPSVPWSGRNLGDLGFHTVTRDWVLSCWEQWVIDLPELLKEERQGPRGYRYYPLWQENVWDCENQAADFQVYACRQHAMMAVHGRFTRGGTGVLNINFTARMDRVHRRDGRHNVNLIVTESRSAITLEPFEQGDGLFFEMDKQEWISLDHIDGR